MPVHSTHIVRIVAADDVVEVLQNAKRAVRRARMVLSAHTIRQGPVRDVLSLLNRCRDLLLQCDLIRLSVSERSRLFQSIDELLVRCHDHLAPVHVVQVHIGVETTGARGRPKLAVDLARVIALRGMGIMWSEIASTIGCSRQTLWRRLQDVAGNQLPRTRNRDPIPDDVLDGLVRQIKEGHAFIGSGIVKGHLEANNISVSLKRVKSSLRRVDPLGAARRRHRSIRRRVYQVRGANYLWHMDQNEKLQPWGFMLLGCVDGYSRLHLWAECRTNKRAATVLRIAYAAFGMYGVPVRIRADRGTENNAVEEFMIQYWGAANSPFLRGRSIQNVRIERMWGDVRKDSTEQFRVLFTSLERDRILRMDLRSHRLCLMLTFMPRIQAVLDRSRHAWNHHQIRTARNRTPIAMFELSREELIGSDSWPGDGTRPHADVGADRTRFDGEFGWAQNVLRDVDFTRDDGANGVLVFLDAVRKLEERVGNVNDEEVVLTFD